MGRKTRDLLKRADGTIESLTQYTYDAIGRLDCTAVRMNPAIYGSLPSSACTPGTTGSQGPDRIARTIYDAAGQRLQLREGVGSADEGTEATWAYNANGQVTTVIDGNGNRATLQYDGHGRQTGWTFPSTTRASAFNDATPALALSTAGSVGSLQELYEYDLNGNRRFLTKRDGARIEYQFDALNRMTVKIVPSRTAGAQALTSAQVRDVYYGYDLRNLQLYAWFDSTSGEGLTNAWDGFGRLTSTSTSMGGTTRTLAYLHDANGNRIRITHPDGNRFETDYDGLNRPAWIWQNQYTAMVNQVYYAHGGMAGRSLANGATSQWGYDGVQRLSAVVQGLAGTVHDGLWTYGRNPAGGIASVGRDNNEYAWAGHYATTRAYTTNGLNQYSAAAGTSFGYDANGNLTTSGSSNYVYDIENRLVGATGGVVLSYDPLGRLHQVSSTAGPTTVFLYDGDALVAEYVSGAMTRRYVHNVGADVPLLSYAGSNLSTPSYLHADERGSIVAISSPSGNGAVNTYDEYGIPGSGNTGRFQYTGQIWLSEIGMYHYKARIYSPTLGRFMQTDPVGYDGGRNLYAYTGNDPINYSDSAGTFRNCSRNDPMCTETEESERQPGDPEEDSEKEAEMAEVVVKGERENRANFSHENEDFFLVFQQQMRPRPMERQSVDCGTYRDPDIVETGQPGAIPPGQMGAHSHGDELAQHPDRRDDSAAHASSGGVAGMFTRNRSFTIRQFSNGTFRVRQRSGAPLTQEERSTLRGHMQGWERPRAAGGSSGNQSLRSRVCRGR